MLPNGEGRVICSGRQGVGGWNGTVAPVPTSATCSPRGASAPPPNVKSLAAKRTFTPGAGIFPRFVTGATIVLSCPSQGTFRNAGSARLRAFDTSMSGLCQFVEGDHGASAGWGPWGGPERARAGG